MRIWLMIHKCQMYIRMCGFQRQCVQVLSTPPPLWSSGGLPILRAVPAVTIPGLVADKMSVYLKSLVYQQSATWLPLTASC